MNEEIVLCASSAYEQKFYLNPPQMFDTPSRFGVL